MAYKSILVVEDDLGIRESLLQFFDGEGYPVLLAENGRVGLDLLEKNASALPGLVLLDLMMPVMDGPAFLAALRSNFPRAFQEIPIFIITAGNDFDRLTIQTSGVIRKPFDLDDLYSLVKLHCGDAG